MELTDLLRTAKTSVDSIYDRLKETSEGTSFPHVTKGIAFSMATTSAYMAKILYVLEHPEIGKKYILSRKKKAEAERATQNARAIQNAIPVQELQIIHENAQQALNTKPGELEQSVENYASALQMYSGKAPTIGPMTNIARVQNSYENLVIALREVLSKLL